MSDREFPFASWNGLECITHISIWASAFTFQLIHDCLRVPFPCYHELCRVSHVDEVSFKSGGIPVEVPCLFFCCLFNNLDRNSYYMLTNNYIIVTIELERMLKEAIVAYFKVLFRHLPGETFKATKKLSSRFYIWTVTPSIPFKQNTNLKFSLLAQISAKELKVTSQGHAPAALVPRKNWQWNHGSVGFDVNTSYN
jgi:hypothetical protein